MGPADTELSPAAARAAARAARRGGAPGGRWTTRVELRLLRLAALIALSGAALLAVAEFPPLLEVRTRAGSVVDTVNVGPHHSWAGLLLAVATAVFVLMFARTRSRPATLAVVVIGLAALGLALAVDVPDTRSTGLVGPHFAEGHARAMIGAYLESVAGVLIALGGALAALPGRGE